MRRKLKMNFLMTTNDLKPCCQGLNMKRGKNLGWLTTEVCLSPQNKTRINSEKRKLLTNPPEEELHTTTSVIKTLQAHISDVLMLHHPFYFSGALKEAVYLRCVLQGWHAWAQLNWGGNCRLTNSSCVDQLSLRVCVQAEAQAVVWLTDALRSCLCGTLAPLH